MIAALEKSLRDLAETRLRDEAQKKQVVGAIMTMFSGLRKKTVPDLAERIKNMQQQVEAMVNDMSLEFVRGELVVKVTGSSDALLKSFRYGSNWFMPEPDVDKIIVAAILVDPKRS
jgi:hypothetical protein